jgi:hypothetical protein
MKNLILMSVLLWTASCKLAYNQSIPYSTRENFLSIWNGTQYVPFFIKGVNLGVSVPGTYPGELAATRSQYGKWFTQIKEAGFNCIRLYTLHYPKFYEVLDSFNQANPHNPLLFIQGVWLNEAFLGYSDDLYQVTDSFRKEIAEDVDCVHGNRFIPERQGKAYGHYSTDASKWCLAYIIGREVYPEEILTTNKNNSSISSFEGKHLSIEKATASEVWFASNLDYLVSFENLNYQTQRPVSVSSWPTLDPLLHAQELNTYEDTVSIDLSKIVLTNAPAGFFISYHAYPYYPDFVSVQSDYQTYFDDYGANSYKGYLTDLKSHYPKYPLIVAEYGVPSSWGIAHYATSGMNHGGFDEYNQGLTDIRLLKTIQETNCGGGIQFAWIDEWFKRTWITDPIDYRSDSRVLWHNITSAEQNFGLVAFKKEESSQTLVSYDSIAAINKIKADANYTFFEIEVGLKKSLNIPDELWIALDTYADELGESILPTGDTIPFRSEFALHITNYSADLYVTEAYDTYGIWHNTSEPQQLFRSTATDGAPWYIVRWKNNSGNTDVQYIGSLQLNYSFQNPSTKDGVTIYDDKIKIRIPWSLINVVAPNQLRVLHDNRSTSEREDTVSTGIRVGTFYQKQWYYANQRFAWPKWNSINSNSLIDTLKTSYFVLKSNLELFNTPALAVRDCFSFVNETYPISISAHNGLLKNDFDLDGNNMIALLIEPPLKGHIVLDNEGSFVYYPFDNFNGTDSLKYCIFDGYSLSEPNNVIFSIAGNGSNLNNVANAESMFSAFPNPFQSSITVHSERPLSEISLFELNGKCLIKDEVNTDSCKLNLSQLKSGVYLLIVKIEDVYYSMKVVKQ